jgi:uncharacterized protein (TIGR03435 family)
MGRIACAVALMVVVVDWAWLHARQASPSFELASVKKGEPPADPILVVPGIRRGNSWVANDATLRMLIRAAYAPQFQTQGTIIGGPTWLDTDRFDITARIDPSVSADTVRLMAQALLADRFSLVLRRESRDLPVYALVHARSDRHLGPQLRPIDIDCAALLAARRRGGAPAARPQPGKPPGDCTTVTHFTGSTMRIESGGMTVADLIPRLSQASGRPVIDHTGLAGYLAFTIEFAADVAVGQVGETTLPPAITSRPVDAASVFAAVEDQLGLKLESRQFAVDVLVIERAEQPSPD